VYVDVLADVIKRVKFGVDIFNGLRLTRDGGLFRPFSSRPSSCANTTVLHMTYSGFETNAET
jgi:hypothetical protein